MSSLRFRATAPEEADRVRAFLAEVFQMSIAAPPFEPALIDWKYYQPRPGWNGSRSYVLERNGEITSHGCVWPMPFQTPEGVVTACQIIDWAASPTAPGAGMLLRREIERMVSVSVAIGGSPDSLKVLSGSGYATVASFRKFVRVVRPFRQFRSRPEPGIGRRLAKFGRNTLWSLASIPTLPAEFTWHPATDFTESPGPVGQSYAATARSGELYRYLLRCPNGSLSGFVLKKRGLEAGFFLLNQVDGQTRIADIQVRAPEDWPSAVLAATRAAAAIPETCEIVANASLDLFAQALGHAGYRLRGEQPVFLLDRAQSLKGAPVHITSADYDDFFARFPDRPFAA